jgi:hypothetical protein
LTYKEAKSLVKERAASKYQGRALLLLTALTNLLYNPEDKDGDVSTRTITRRVETVQGWLAAVSERQLTRIAKQVEEITIVSRDKRKVTFSLNLELLKDVEKSAALTTRVLQMRKESRAAKARAQRAANHQSNRVADMSNLMQEMRPAFYESVLHPQHVAA